MSGKRKHNTRGPVVGETAPTQKPAAEANPKTKPETADERGRLQRIKDGIDEGIDQYVESSGYSTSAMVLGAAAKAVNEVFMPTAIYEIIPVGKVFKFGKKATDAVGITKKGEKAADKAGDAGKAQGKAGDKADAGGGQGRNKDGGKGKYRPKKRVKCFCVQDKAKGGREEYDRQLHKQQEGINSMSADDYLTERRAFTGKDPCCGYKATAEGKTKIRDPGVTRKAKAERLSKQADRYSKELRSKGRSSRDADRLGEAKAKRELGSQDALHNQDMVAAGDDAIGALGADGKRVYSDGDFGFSDTNRHIGSQWNGERIKSMDAEACEMSKNGQGTEKMNVELRPCGKHEAAAAGCKQKGKKARGK